MGESKLKEGVPLSAQLAKRSRLQLVSGRNTFKVPGFHFTATGLTIEDWVTPEAWERAGRELEVVNRAIQWYWGDWLAHAERKAQQKPEWGEKLARVKEAHEKTGIPVNTLRDYQRVAGQIEIDVRSSDLDWSVQREVAGLPKDRQKQVIAKALQSPKKWTKRAVERYVQTGLEPGEKSGVNASVLAETAGKIEVGADLKAIGDRAMIQFLLEVKQSIADLKTKCPRPKFVTDVFDGWVEDIDDYLEQLALVALKDKVIQAWRSGKREEKQIAAATGIPTAEIHGVMMAYKREGLFEKVKRAKTKMAKGTAPWIWHLKGEPVGSDYQPDRAA